MSVSGVLAKGIGAVGLGLVLYDAHTSGKIESASYEKKCAADMVTGPYLNTMTQDSASVLESRAKKGFSNYMMEENMSGFFTSIGGYFKGVGSMLVSHVVPLGLSIGALATRRNSLASRVFGFGLLAYGAVFMLHEVMGIGKGNELNSNF